MARDIIVKFIPVNKWYKRTRWQLMLPYPNADKTLSVPVGFITDGASVPLPFTNIFSPTGKYFGAAIIHDYLLENNYGWAYANNILDSELKSSNIPKWRRRIIMAAVRAYSMFKK